MYLNSISYFRAIAIIAIVAGHCQYISELFYPDAMYTRIAANLLDGGTHFFAFISGFMFFHVYEKNFNFPKFLIKKIKKIVIPYILMSIIPLLYFTYKFNLITPFGVQDNYILSFLFRLFAGYSFAPYWYIPVIMSIFLLSPLFLLFARSNFRVQLGVWSLAFLLALFIQRASSNTINVIQNVLYLSPVYMLGILCSKYKHHIYRIFERREYALLLAGLCLACSQAFFSDVTGSFYKDPFIYNGIDLMLMQKTMLSLFFMTWLRKYEQQDMDILHLIAKISFPIYFIHAYFLAALKRLPITTLLLRETLGTYGDFLIYLLFLTFVLAASVIVSILIKKYLHKYSQLLIGW